jgi:hypothetical protein
VTDDLPIAQFAHLTNIAVDVFRSVLRHRPPRPPANLNYSASPATFRRHVRGAWPPTAEAREASMPNERNGTGDATVVIGDVKRQPRPSLRYVGQQKDIKVSVVVAYQSHQDPDTADAKSQVWSNGSLQDQDQMTKSN